MATAPADHPRLRRADQRRARGGLPGWEVVVGPQRGVGPRPLPEAARRLTPCPGYASCPRNVAVEVPAGAPDSRGGDPGGARDLELPCGGQGTCGQCLVETSRAGGDARRLVPACQTKVREDVMVRIPESGRTWPCEVVGRQPLPDRDPRAAAGPRARSRRCSATVSLTVPPASIEEHYSDWMRLVRGLERAGCPTPIAAGLGVLQEPGRRRCASKTAGSRSASRSAGGQSR